MEVKEEGGMHGQNCSKSVKSIKIVKVLKSYTACSFGWWLVCSERKVLLAGG
jgi:hypothetical protein